MIPSFRRRYPEITSESTPRIVDEIGATVVRWLTALSARIGKRGHLYSPVFRPRRNVLPDTEFFVSLRLGFITPPVTLLQIQHLQALQVFL